MSVLGSYWRVSTFGESHGGGVGAVLEGVPPRMRLTAADVQPQLDRRRPGQSRVTTQRKERDAVEIVSGTEAGYTLGSPICLLIRNRDHRPADYDTDIPRPSHADWSTEAKYGIRPNSGGGRSSARETAARVAAGAVAELWLQQRFGVSIVAYVSSVGNITCPPMDKLSREQVDQSMVRCPDPVTSDAMLVLIDKVREQQDSIGGTVTCICSHVPAGWGEPCFDKLEATLAHAMMSIPASKGFEIGSGFSCATQRGSQHNDPWVAGPQGLVTSTNNSGGVQGGISNGMPIVFRTAFKPAATIARPQTTADASGATTTLCMPGRHDPCVLPRAVPIVEAMAALALADAAAAQLAREQGANSYPRMGRLPQ